MSEGKYSYLRGDDERDNYHLYNVSRSFDERVHSGPQVIFFFLMDSVIFHIFLIVHGVPPL